MAKWVLSKRRFSAAAAISKRCGISPTEMSGKSDSGKVESVNRERPERSVICPLSPVASKVTWLPSGSLRTISYKVWAGAVTPPPWVISAGTVSLTSMSRSVALKASAPSMLRTSTFERMGMVLRRSTTR